MAEDQDVINVKQYNRIGRQVEIIVLVRAGEARQMEELIYVVIPLKRSLFEAIETLEEFQHIWNGLMIGKKLAVSLWRRHLDSFFELGVEKGGLNIHIMYFSIEMSGQG